MAQKHMRSLGMVGGRRSNRSLPDEQAESTRRWLRQVVSKEGGPTKAAGVLGISQPYISEMLTDPPTRTPAFKVAVAVARRLKMDLEVVLGTRPASTDRPMPHEQIVDFMAGHLKVIAEVSAEKERYRIEADQLRLRVAELETALAKSREINRHLSERPPAPKARPAHGGGGNGDGGGNGHKSSNPPSGA